MNIVKDLNVFSRRDKPDKEILNINDCILNTLRMIKNEVKYTAGIKTKLGNIPETQGFPGNLSQVILNLVINAKQAIDDFGAIIVTTTSEGNTIYITVEDNVRGIDEETKRHIFDPFFTTKEVGESTRLGLSIAMGIIEKHQGTIDVTSEQGKGTCFTISLSIITE